MTPEARLLARLRERYPVVLTSPTTNATIATTGERSYRVPDLTPRTTPETYVRHRSQSGGRKLDTKGPQRAETM